jgi:hypothetical protein
VVEYRRVFHHVGFFYSPQLTELVEESAVVGWRAKIERQQVVNHCIA